MLEGLLVAQQLVLHAFAQPEEHARRVDKITELYEEGRWTTMLEHADEYVSLLALNAPYAGVHLRTLYDRATQVSLLTQEVRARIASFHDSLSLDIISPGIDSDMLTGDPVIIISYPTGGLVSQSFVRPDGKVTSLHHVDTSVDEALFVEPYKTHVSSSAKSREDAYERVLSRVHEWYSERVSYG